MSARGGARVVTRMALLAAALGAQACTIEKATEAETGLELNTAASRLLESAVAGWNTGDLEAWLDAYLASETTTLAAGGGTLVGLDEIRRQAAPRFATGARRDSVRIEAIRSRRLGALYGLVTGRRSLQGQDGIRRAGPFTLVLRRVGGGWKIIHDHGLFGIAPVPSERIPDRPDGP